MSEHTKEPWRTAHVCEESGWVDLYSDHSDGLPIGSTRHARAEADARRIVACVNACAGVETEKLEKYQLGVAAIQEMIELERQRDELLAALKALADAHQETVRGEWASDPEDKEYIAARALIAKLEAAS